MAWKYIVGQLLIYRVLGAPSRKRSPSTSPSGELRLQEVITHRQTSEYLFDRQAEGKLGECSRAASYPALYLVWGLLPVEPKFKTVNSWVGKKLEHPLFPLLSFSSSFKLLQHMSPQSKDWRAVLAYNSQLQSKRPAKSCQRLAVPWTTSHINKVGTPLRKKKKMPWLFASESDLPTKPQPFPGLMQKSSICGFTSV